MLFSEQIRFRNDNRPAPRPDRLDAITNCNDVMYLMEDPENQRDSDASSNGVFNGASRPRGVGTHV